MRLIDIDAFWNYVRSHKINFGKYQHDLLNRQPTVQAVPIDVLDKIRAEIEKAIWEDVVVTLDGTDETRIPRLDPDEVLEIIDKYKAESEETETWNGIHAQITAPKGTFDKLWEDAKAESEDKR